MRKPTAFFSSLALAATCIAAVPSAAAKTQYIDCSGQYEVCVEFQAECGKIAGDYTEIQTGQTVIGVCTL